METMKLLKNRLTARPISENDDRGERSPSRRKMTALGFFVDSFRKGNSSRRQSSAVIEDEIKLLNQSSFAHSDHTEPTDALTVASESLSVASEEITNALNKTFAIFRNPSSALSSNPSQSVVEEEEENDLETMLSSHSSYDRMAELETASNLSDPKNHKLRSRSHNTALKGSQAEQLTVNNNALDADLKDVCASASSLDTNSVSDTASFDPEQYLLDLEAKKSGFETVATLGEDFDTENGEEGIVEQDDKLDEEVVEVEVELQASATTGSDVKPIDGKVHSPLHSVCGGDSLSSGSAGWENGSTHTGDASLLDVALRQENGANEDGDNVSTANLDDVSIEGGDGSVEGPTSPHSRTSSVLLDEYNEMEGITALADIFMSLVSCNFTDVAANVFIDDDDYSLDEEDSPILSGAFPNLGMGQESSSTTRRRSVSERVATPTFRTSADVWSMFNNCS